MGIRDPLVLFEDRVAIEVKIIRGPIEKRFRSFWGGAEPLP